MYARPPRALLTLTLLALAACPRIAPEPAPEGGAGCGSADGSVAQHAVADDDFAWCYTDDGGQMCFAGPGGRARCEARDAGPCMAF